MNIVTERPKGITILGWLHLIGGALMPIAIVFLAVAMNRYPEGASSLARFGFPQFLIYFGMVIIGALCLSSGIGMLKGKQWGWYLGSFYYVYSILKDTNALLLIPSMMSKLTPEEIEGMSWGPNYYMSKYGIRIVIYLLLYLYFYKKNVLQFFRLAEKPKWKAILAQVGVAVLIAVVSEFLG